MLGENLLRAVLAQGAHAAALDGRALDGAGVGVLMASWRICSSIIRTRRSRFDLVAGV